jgi:septal ring factor EnvC (AmiA/AmiB activator)
MNTTIQHNSSALLSRRQVLKLAVTSVLLVAGCATMSSSDLDKAVSNLNGLLDQIADNERQELLTSIAQRIKLKAQELGAEHQAFVGSFDRMLNKHDTTEAQLKQAIEAYSKRRQQLRNDLLGLQDELHTSMTPDEWDKVVEVLNQTGKAIASYTLSEA